MLIRWSLSSLTTSNPTQWPMWGTLYHHTYSSRTLSHAVVHPVPSHWMLFCCPSCKGCLCLILRRCCNPPRILFHLWRWISLYRVFCHARNCLNIRRIRWLVCPARGIDCFGRIGLCSFCWLSALFCLAGRTTFTASWVCLPLCCSCGRCLKKCAICPSPRPCLRTCWP